MRGILHAEDFGWSNAPRFGGMGGGSPSGNTTTTTTNVPWAPQQPYLTEGFSGANNLYSNPSDYPQYFGGIGGVSAPGAPTYAPLNDMQGNALDNLYYAGSIGGNPAQTAAEGFLPSTLDPSYTNETGGPFNTANGTMNWLAGGGVLNVTGQPFNQSNSALSNELSPGFTNPWNSPAFNTVVNNTLASVMPSIQSSYIGGNRSDSGLAARAASMGATDAVGNLAQNQFNTQQQLQQQGIQQAATNEGLGLQGLEAGQNLAANDYLTQQGNQFKAAALAPGIDAQTMSDLQTAYSAASPFQQNAQGILDSAANQWNYNQSLPFNMLSYFQNAINGNYGGTSTLQQPYYQNQGANALSGGLGGLGIGNALFSAFPQTLGSLGLTSGSTGLLGSILGAGAAIFSDRNLKDDIHKVGTLDNHLPFYSFRYKWDEPGTLRLGVMAQDVQKVKPDAVTKTPFGLAVDYEKALA